MKLLNKHSTYGHISIWVGAAAVGIFAVLYAKLVNFAQDNYFELFKEHPILVTLFTPFAFLGATALVRRFSPQAKGSGIPQVLEAIELTEDPATRERAWNTNLISIKTAFVKVISSTLGIFGGASIGREGPTIQIASSTFAWVARLTRKKIPGISLRAYLIAGSAAGVAAAFNTPLAGITFAIEELAEGAIHTFRQTAMLAIIISGITAQALLGNYLYFGHFGFLAPDFSVLPQAIFIGLIAGLFGGVFAKLLAFPGLMRLPKVWWPRTLFCGALCALIGYFTSGDTAGSGYEVTRRVLSLTSTEEASFLFPLWKLSTTVLSYLSGMAGGIFSPCLTIGAGIGVTFAKLFNIVGFKTCALIGMVAFFSAVVQAPLTAVIIVMEMTNEHILIIPFMIAAFIGNGVGALLMPIPLYRKLAMAKMDT